MCPAVQNLYLITFIVFSLLFPYVSAGAGANVWGCIWFPQAPNSLPVVWEFGDPENDCMKVNMGTINAKTPPGNASGAICWDFGYQESIISGSCAFAPSLWSMKFSVGGTANPQATGFSTNIWRVNTLSNQIQLSNSSSQTQICSGNVPCGNTQKINWDHGTSPSLYFHFFPYGGGGKSIEEDDAANPLVVQE